MSAKPTIEEIKSALSPEYATLEIRETQKEEEGMVFLFGKRVGGYITRFYTSTKIKQVIFALIMLASALDGFWTVYKLDDAQTKTAISEFSDPNSWRDKVITFQTPENQDKVFLLGSFGSPSPSDGVNLKPYENTYISISGSAILPVSQSPYNTGYSGQAQKKNQKT